MSPTMTVVVLAVLWLIVVVPMIVRRNDERRRERSVAAFGRGMRALGRRAHTADADPATARTEVFAPRETSAPLATPARRPVPAAQEALMYPPDRSELTEARVQMLARRRRSLGVLIGGSILFTLLGLIVGGLVWILAVGFLLGLGGYLLFLRNQALRDRARRETRLARATASRPEADEYDATTEYGRFDDAPVSVVRIDDDDIELSSLDTIDLTGLYTDDGTEAEEAVARRAS